MLMFGLELMVAVLLERLGDADADADADDDDDDGAGLLLCRMW